MKQAEVSPEQDGRESEHETTKTLAGAAGRAAASGAAPAGDAALHTVSTGIRSGLSPLQFMDSIDAGGRQLGNRAFMRWVGQLHAGAPAGNAHEIADRGLQGPGRPLTHLDTLQQAFGHHDIRDMREHTGPVAGTALDALDAEGYTRGGRMALAGAPDLYTQAHEAAHGVQQAALGERMMLPGGIGAAGDRYERQADAVAQAVVRGESAQPLLDPVTAGPVRVNAACAGDAAPVQMKPKKNKRRNQSRPRDPAGDGMPDLEQASQELADVVADQDIATPAGSSMDLEPYIDEQGLQGPFAENPLYNPLPGGGMDIQQAGGGMDSLQAGGEALEQAVQQLDNLAGQMDVQQPAGGSMDSQQAGEALESLSGQSMPDSHAVSEEIQQATGSRQSLADEEVGEFLDPKTHPPDVPARGEKPTLTDRARGYAGRRYAQFFPGTQPAGDDDRRGILERNLRYFLPLVACLYDAAGQRAGQVRTEEHGPLSLRGMLNMLATVMLWLLMAGAALPVDVVGNILGVVARIVMGVSTLLGLPADGILMRYLQSNPPEDKDHKRAKSEKLTTRGFLNEFIPKTLVFSGFSGYFQASIAQGNVSPTLWLQPWTAARIAIIILRVILDNIIVATMFTLGPAFALKVLVGKLKWSAGRAKLYLGLLSNIFAETVNFIASYVTNPEVSIFLAYQNLRLGAEVGDDREKASGDAMQDEQLTHEQLTHKQTMAALYGYAALGLLIQILFGTLLFYNLASRLDDDNLNPWAKQFKIIPNRLYRTIAIALAAARNAIILVMTVTNIASLVVTNIIGPLAQRFGQGGYCVWPAAVAGVCGGPPDDFAVADFFGRIQEGEENMSDSDVLGLQLFPAAVGLLGLGSLIGYLIARLCRHWYAGRRQGAGRGAGSPDRGGSGGAGRGPARRDRRRSVMPFRRRRSPESEERFRLVEEGGVPDSVYDVIRADALGSASDTDEGEAEDPVYETIQSPGGTLRRKKQRRQRPLPSSPSQAIINFDAIPEVAEFSPLTRNLYGTYSRGHCNMSHVRDAVMRHFDFRDIPKKEKDWLLTWAMAARNIDQDLSPEEVNRAIASYIDPETSQVVQPGAAAQAPGETATVEIEAQHSPEASQDTQAFAVSAPARNTRAELEKSALDNIPVGLTIGERAFCLQQFMCFYRMPHRLAPSVDSVGALIEGQQANGILSEEAARRISAWAVRYLIPAASTPVPETSPAPETTPAHETTPVPGTTPTPETSPAPSIVSTHSPQPSASSHSGSSYFSMHSPAEQLYLFLIEQQGLTEAEMEQHIESWLANGRITASEAADVRRRVMSVVLFPLTV